MIITIKRINFIGVFASALLVSGFTVQNISALAYEGVVIEEESKDEVVVETIIVEMTREEWNSFVSANGWDNVELVGKDGEYLIFEAFKDGVKVADVFLKEALPLVGDGTEDDNIMVTPTPPPSEGSASFSVKINYAPTVELSLSTSSISFGNLSSMEDTEIENGLMISVNSNLPYGIRAKLLNPIQSIEDEGSLDSSILNIKDSYSSEYLAFEKVGNLIELVSNYSPELNNKHYFDFKISANDSYQRVKGMNYEAKIKFEVYNK